MSDLTTSGTKLCPTCGDEKHVLAFALNRSQKDGLSSQCRECVNSYGEKRQHRKSRLAGTRGAKQMKAIAVRRPIGSVLGDG